MNIQEAKIKLTSAIKAAVRNHFESLVKINPRGYEMVIESVEEVYVRDLNEKDLDLQAIFLIREIKT